MFLPTLKQLRYLTALDEHMHDGCGDRLGGRVDTERGVGLDRDFLGVGRVGRLIERHPVGHTNPFKQGRVARRQRRDRVGGRGRYSGKSQGRVSGSGHAVGRGLPLLV